MNNLSIKKFIISIVFIIVSYFFISRDVFATEVENISDIKYASHIKEAEAILSQHKKIIKSLISLKIQCSTGRPCLESLYYEYEVVKRRVEQLKELKDSSDASLRAMYKKALRDFEMVKEEYRLEIKNYKRSIKEYARALYTLETLEKNFKKVLGLALRESGKKYECEVINIFSNFLSYKNNYAYYFIEPEPWYMSPEQESDSDDILFPATFEAIQDALINGKLPSGKRVRYKALFDAFYVLRRGEPNI